MINCVCGIHHCCKSHSNMVNQHVATWLIRYSKKWVCGCLCTCTIVNSSVVLMIVVKDADIFFMFALFNRKIFGASILKVCVF